MIEVDRLKPSEAEEWDAFLRGKPGALFVHSVAYRDLLAAELDCEAEYLVAREGGEIRGVLPLMWAEDEEGRVCNSLPYFGSHGGPVSADRRAGRALIEAWNERALDPRTLAANMIENPFLEDELPPPVHDATDERISQFTALAGDGSEDGLMALISGEARNNVRRAARRGVVVRRDNGAIEEVWRVHDQNMAARGAPARSRRFLETLAARLRPGADYDIWTADVEGQVAAALLVVRFNGVSEYFTSGTRAGFRRRDPHAALIFAALRREIRNGARIWNWGGTHHGMNGVFHFKRKWGSSQGRYRYFVKVNAPYLLDATPGELVARFPGFFIVPFSALRPAVA